MTLTEELPPGPALNPANVQPYTSPPPGEAKPKPVQRTNPADADAPKKWYVTQVTTAQVDETQVAMDLE